MVKYVINRLLHDLFYIGPGIIPRPISAQGVSG